MKRLAILMGTVVLGVPAARSAEKMLCYARVPSTTCSTGNIQVKFDPEAKTHETLVGAVRCWGSDYDFSGEMKEVENAYPYFESSHFTLHDQTGDQQAHFYIEKPRDDKYIRPAASLVMNSVSTPRGPLVATQFNLVCEKVREPKPDPEPKPGFPNDDCRPGNCFEW